jgi:hypothetical protein
MSAEEFNAEMTATSGTTAKAPKVGEPPVGGEVVAHTKKQKTDYTTGEPVFWKSGDPRFEHVITFQPDGTTDDVDLKRIYMNENQTKALIDALKQEGLSLFTREEHGAGTHFLIKCVVDPVKPGPGVKGAQGVYECKVTPQVKPPVNLEENGW